MTTTTLEGQSLSGRAVVELAGERSWDFILLDHSALDFSGDGAEGVHPVTDPGTGGGVNTVFSPRKTGGGHFGYTAATSHDTPVHTRERGHHHGHSHHRGSTSRRNGSSLGSIGGLLLDYHVRVRGGCGVRGEVLWGWGVGGLGVRESGVREVRGRPWG